MRSDPRSRAGVHWRTIFTHGTALLVGLAIGVLLSRSSSSPEPTPELSVAQDATPIQNAPVTVESDSSGKQQVVEEPSSSRGNAFRTPVARFEQAMSRDEFSEAEAIVREMEADSPRGREFLESISRLLVRQRKWEDAKASLKRCVEMHPTSRSCLVDMASTEAQVGSKEELDLAARSCLRNHPNHPQCLNLSAISAMNSGNPAEAARIYRQLLEKNGGYGVRFDDEMLHWQLGLALEDAGQYEEASRHFSKACEKNFAQSCKKYDEVRAKL